MLNQIKTGKEPKPIRMVVYGLGGIGKSSMGASMPNPIFIDTEGRLAHIDCSRFPQATTLAQVQEQLRSILQEEHSYKTLVIDSLDWLESLVHNHVAKQHNATSVAAIPYGVGYGDAYGEWEKILAMLTLIRDQKKMSIFCTGHSTIKRFESPDTESYDQYRIELRDKVMEKIFGWSDLFMFCNYKTRVKEGTDGVKRGATTGQRAFYTKDSPAYRAKDSYNLPASIVVDEVKEVWPIINKHLKEFYGYNGSKKNS